MSELKAVHAFDVYDAYAKTGDDDAAQVYLKSEADLVIADLKDKLRHYPMMAALIENGNKEINKLKDLNHALMLDALRDRDRIRHQKYKRCLAMAKKCCEKKENLYNRALRKYSKDEANYLIRKSDFWENWEHRWLAIAEKFKEAK